MNIKQEISLIATIFNTFLTILKFIAYFFTGSISIFSEAWHSLMDIATSTSLYVAIRSKKYAKLSYSEPVLENKKGINNILRKIKTLSLEYKVSFGIGILLFIVSFSLLRNVITYKDKAITIQNSLIAGILFIVFSIGSYILYKLETKVGKEESSPGLISDGMHAKADMTMSLLVGFSLISYKLGVNIDRFVALIITVFIFLYAVETIINIIAFYTGKHKKDSIHSKTIFIVLSIFDIEKWKTVISFLGLDKLDLLFYKKLLKYFILLLVIFFLCIYLSTSFYLINYNQEGIIKRFGKSIYYPVLPGLHLKLPWPIEKIDKIDSKIVQEIYIGNIPEENSVALLWTKEHGDKEAFLSGDNCFFFPYIILHYRINDVFKYRYSHKDPKALLDSVAHRIFCSIFTKKIFYEIVTDYRKILEKETHRLIQEEINKLNCGIEVVSVNIKDIHPPISIASFFEKVIAAYQEKERQINIANKEKNEFILEAQGKAEKTIKDAEIYTIKKVEYSKGESSRFVMRIPSPNYKNISRCRLYLDMIKKGLSGKRKIIVDPKSGIPEIWIDFGNILNQEKGGKINEK